MWVGGAEEFTARECPHVLSAYRYGKVGPETDNVVSAVLAQFEFWRPAL